MDKPKLKRRKIELKIEQKWAIIEYAKQYPNIKQTQLILHFNKEFNVNIKKQTMSDILSQKSINKISHQEDVENLNKRI